MYAIVKTGGKQYRVERGQRLLVERLAVEAGDSVPLEPVLYRSDETVFDADGLSRVHVTAKVVEHVRGQKLRVFKFKPKRGYRRRTGHRQDLTRIEVTDISLGGSARRARAKPEGGAEPQAKSQGGRAAGSGAGRAAAGSRSAGSGAAKPSQTKEAEDGS